MAEGRGHRAAAHRVEVPAPGGVLDPTPPRPERRPDTRVPARAGSTRLRLPSTNAWVMRTSPFRRCRTDRPAGGRPGRVRRARVAAFYGPTVYRRLGPAPGRGRTIGPIRAEDPARAANGRKGFERGGHDQGPGGLAEERRPVRAVRAAGHARHLEVEDDPDRPRVRLRAAGAEHVRRGERPRFPLRRRPRHAVPRGDGVRGPVAVPRSGHRGDRPVGRRDRPPDLRRAVVRRHAARRHAPSTCSAGRSNAPATWASRR